MHRVSKSHTTPNLTTRITEYALHIHERTGSQSRGACQWRDRQSLQFSLAVEVYYCSPNIHTNTPVTVNENGEVYGSPDGTLHAPLTHQRLSLPHELSHCMITRKGQLANAALLPLMGRVWVNVALPSPGMNSAPLVGTGQARSSDWRAACLGLMGRKRGGWTIEFVVPGYLYCPA